MSKRMLLLVFLCLTTGVVQAESSSEDGKSKTLLEGDASAGASLTGVCASCHGADGNSTNPVWPKLAGQNAPYIFHQLQLFKSGERQNALMTAPVADLDEQDMRNLALYFAQQKTKPGVANESLVKDGAAIYHGGIPEENVPACAGCHGPAGLGNPTSKYPRISGQHAPYVNMQLKAYRDGERDDYRTGKIMGSVAADLSDEDIKALAFYVEGLQPREPKQ